MSSPPTPPSSWRQCECSPGWVRADASDLPGVTAASLSVLGMVAVTAYQGIFEVLDCKAEHTVLVSGAAGAVGSAAIQYAKHIVGAKRVVGIAGGPDKCKWVESIGADACVDYKDPNFAANLKEALQGYADRYFENVGGEVLNAAFRLIKRHGKIGICGMISGECASRGRAGRGGAERSQQARPHRARPADKQTRRRRAADTRLQRQGHPAPQLLRGHLEPHYHRGYVCHAGALTPGFLVLDVVDRYGQIVQKIAGWAKEGKIKLDESETVVPTKIDDIPKTWQRLFRGENRGKLVTQLVA